MFGTRGERDERIAAEAVLNSRVSRRVILGTLLASLALPACARDSGGQLTAVPAREAWPDQFWKAAPEVQEAFRFAIANGEILRFIPCYCGCGAQGHQSNRDCYVREIRPDGTVVLDQMGFG